MAFVLGNYRQLRGQEIAVTYYISEKTFRFVGHFCQFRDERATETHACKIAWLSCDSSSSVRMVLARSTFVTSKNAGSFSNKLFELRTTSLPGTYVGKLAQHYAPIIVGKKFPQGPPKRE